MPTVKGTASVSDSRARTKALRNTRFPRNFRTPVNLEKVNKPVLTQWIEQKITSILGFDDEIVSSTAINLFLPSDNSCDPKKAQLDLTGFLGDDTATFCAELWSLMLEAQASTSGIPQTLLEQKKKEMAEKLSRSNGGQQVPYRSQPERPSEKAGTSGQDGFNSSANPTARNSSGRNEDKTNKVKNEDHRTTGEQKQQLESNKAQGVPEQLSTDQFGRVVPIERSRDAPKQTPRNQHDRTRSYHAESSRRPRERSRSRERYNVGRDREPPDYRRRFDERHRGMDGDRRRMDDRRYHPNQYHERPGYHDHYHRHHNHNHHYDRDRDRDRDRNRDQYHESWDRRDRRYEDHEVEVENLERRLAQLRKQYCGRDRKNTGRGMHRIEDEMNDIQDRLYELETRRRRYASSRGDDRRHRSHRDRSPSYEYRRNERRQRSSSADSESSRSVERSGDDHSTDGSTRSRGSSNRSYSPSPERSKKNRSRSNKKRQRRRRSRSRSISEGSEQSS